MNMKSSIKPAHLWRVRGTQVQMAVIYTDRMLQETKQQQQRVTMLFFCFVFFLLLLFLSYRKSEKVTAKRNSLCTWKGRYAGSCAADPGASQNDLSVKKKKRQKKLSTFSILRGSQKIEKNIKAVSFCYQTAYSKTVFPNLF